MDRRLPVSQEALCDELPLGDFFAAVRQRIEVGLLDARVIDVASLAQAGVLLATQAHHQKGDEEDSPVFQELPWPVVFEFEGVGYILDGHHRLERAFEECSEMTVYWLG